METKQQKKKPVKADYRVLTDEELVNLGQRNPLLEIDYSTFKKSNAEKEALSLVRSKSTSKGWGAKRPDKEYKIKVYWYNFEHSNTFKTTTIETTSSILTFINNNKDNIFKILHEGKVVFSQSKLTK
jgi:hypothetical protein